jgi:hypothetical protein
MKTVILSAIMISLMIGAPLAYAETVFQSGFKHGVADAKMSGIYCIPRNLTCPDTKSYIHQSGQGFANHTTGFVNGYIKDGV